MEAHMPKYITMTDADLINAVHRAIRSVNPQKNYKPDSLTDAEIEGVLLRLEAKLQLDKEQAAFLFQNYRGTGKLAQKLYLLKNPDSPTGFIDLLALRRRIWRNLTGMHILMLITLFFTLFVTAVSLTSAPDAGYPAALFGTLFLVTFFCEYLPTFVRNKWMLRKIVPQAPTSFYGKIKRIAYRTEIVYDMGNASRVDVYHLIFAVDQNGKTEYYVYPLQNEYICMNYRNRRAVRRALDAIPNDQSYFFTVEGAALQKIRPTVIKKAVTAIRSPS